jgi:hypothetical protein
MIKKLFDIDESHRKSLKLLHNSIETLSQAKRVAENAPEDLMSVEILERHHLFRKKLDKIDTDLRKAYYELLEEEKRY